NRATSAPLLFRAFRLTCRTQLRDGAFDLSAGLEQIFARFGSRVFLHASLALPNVLSPFGDALPAFFARFLIGYKLRFTVAQSRLSALKFSKQRAHRSLLFRHARFRARDERRGKIEPARDAESIRPTRNPLQQPIRRRELTFVELQRCVDD